MKKMTILLFTIVCAGQLYGMEKEKEEAVGLYTSSEMLPEIKQQIISAALASSKNVDEAIDAIKKFSILHGVQFDKFFNNLQTFSKVVSLLIEKYPQSTHSVIAKKLNPSLAKEYDALNKRLTTSGSVEVVAELLNQGADINYQSKGDSPLSLAVLNVNADSVKFLLEHGANPFIEFESIDKKGMTVLDSLNRYIGGLNNFSAIYGQDPDIVDRLNEAEKIKMLLENAMKK